MWIHVPRGFETVDEKGTVSLGITHPAVFVKMTILSSLLEFQLSDTNCKVLTA